MNPDKPNSEKKLLRWLLIATIALLLLVLGLQLWQMFGRKGYNGSLPPDSANDPAAPQTTEPLNPAAVSPGKAAMVEDVLALNDSLSAEALSTLSAEELEQLWETGAPGLPIGLSAAALAAETWAGTLEMDSVTWDADPELDEAPAHYEVKLHHATGDFEYKIHAYTGEVLEGPASLFQNVPAANEEALPAAQENPPAAQTTPPAAGQDVPPAGQQATQPPAAQDGLIGEDAAKAAAFTHAGVREADVVMEQIHLDWEDRTQVYEIEFQSGGKEYDYEVEAATGTIRKAEQKWGDTPLTAGDCIGEDAALTAALTHAGVSKDSAQHVKWKLDRDDGRLLYEVEFRAGTVEYEYEIDALTGAVLKAEMDD